MLNNIIIGAILGLVQGISEWLPISSKTQVAVASISLLHLTFSQAYTLGLFFEIGTIVAAVIYFRKELVSLVRVIAFRGSHGEKKLFVYVLVTTVITGGPGCAALPHSGLDQGNRDRNPDADRRTDTNRRCSS